MTADTPPLTSEQIAVKMSNGSAADARAALLRLLADTIASTSGVMFNPTGEVVVYDDNCKPIMTLSFPANASQTPNDETTTFKSEVKV